MVSMGTATDNMALSPSQLGLHVKGLDFTGAGQAPPHHLFWAKRVLPKFVVSERSEFLHSAWFPRKHRKKPSCPPKADQCYGT